jgi:hypothetical protein
VSDLIKDISITRGVPEQSICCLTCGEVVLPFVKVRCLSNIKVRFARDGDVRPRIPCVLRSVRQDQLRRGRRKFAHRIRVVLTQVNGTALPMIVDTGASMSVIYSLHALQCGVDWMIDSRPSTRIVFSGVQGTSDPAVGIIQALRITIGNLVTYISVAVIDGDFAAGLLGIDWMHANDVVIDIVNDCMHVGAEVIQFVDL